MTNKKTSSKVATQAAKTLKSKYSSKIQKQLAGSVLSQTKTNKTTSEEVEKIAQKALLSDKYSKKTKSLAGSALSQSD